MATQISKAKARFDTRLPQEQKELFEKAAQLGGYRSLTDFVILAAEEKANKIIEEKAQIIASQRDAEIFFNLVTQESEPNTALAQAAQVYKSLVSE